MATALTEYGPFDAGPGADFMEADWRSAMRHVIPTGVLIAERDQFEVFADSSGMQVKLKAGECWIRGHWGMLDAQATVPIAAAHATLARIDRVILRAHFLNNAVEWDVLTGTAASSPVAPALTQNTSVWEISLATVSVAAGATTVAASNVTDTRLLTGSPIGYARHTWGGSSNVTLAHGSNTALTFPDQHFNDGLATWDNVNGQFTLNRAGRWSLTMKCNVDGNGTSSSGLVTPFFELPSGATDKSPWFPRSVWGDDRFLVGSDPALWLLQATVTYVGFITPKSVGQPINARIKWTSTGTGSSKLSIRTLHLEYMGGR